MTSFDLFGPPTKCDIKVGYISTDRGYVSGVGVHEANLYAKQNPGTTFIFATREKIRYLNINEVNRLTVDDLVTQIDTCKGIQLDGDIEKPKITFAGGGGIGAQANPVIGLDGSLLAVDLVRGGHGYRFPPIVELKDDSGSGAGAVIRASIGTTATVYQTYDDEDDFEEYDLKTCAPEIIPPSPDYSVTGENLGGFDSNSYKDNELSAYDQEVKKYVESLSKIKNPFWTTRDEPPLKVAGDGKVSRSFYEVEFPFWRDFLNQHGISPVPPSNAKGSDFSNRWYSFEWNVEIPYDGDYTFRSQCDNDGRLFFDNLPFTEFKIGKGGAAGSVLSSPLVFKKTLKEGNHKLRLELFNHPIKEKVNVQNETLRLATTKNIDFKISTATLFGATVDIPELDISLKKVYGENADIVESFNKVIEYGKVYDVNITSTGQTAQLRTNGQNVLQMEDIPNTDAGGGGVGVFFDDVIISASEGKFFDIKGTNCKFVLENPPIDDRSSESNEVISVFNTADFMDKANRRLWRTNIFGGGFLDSYGVSPFDTEVTLDYNPYAGIHEIVWENVSFPVTGEYIIEIQVDDSVTLEIGDQLVIRKEGFVTGTSIPTGKLKQVYSISQGTYKITAKLEQIPGGSFGFGSQKGLNPMALGINIRTSFEEQDQIAQKSFNENPMAIAMIIEAPDAPIPEAPIPKSEGRCPPNPFWTTRTPGATSSWHPVRFDFWPKFLNSYAMSPVPPFSESGTSAGGQTFTNEWSVNIPYDGYYKLRGEVDDIAQFFIDDQLVLDLSRRVNKVKGENKFFLSEGLKKLKVVVENYKFEEQKLVDQKLFSTADWVNSVPIPPKSKSVTFKVSTASLYANGVKIEGLDLNASKDYGDGKDIKETIVKDVNLGEVYDVEFSSLNSVAGVKLRSTSNQGGQIVEMEDHTDESWDDLVISTTDGRFYDFKNGSNVATCKFTVPFDDKLSIQNTLVGGTQRDGVSYSGPRLAGYLKGFISPFHTDPEEIQDKTWIMSWNNINFPETGQYTLKMRGDDDVIARIDGKEIGKVNVFDGEREFKFNVSAGKRNLEIELYNLRFANTTFNENPTYASVLITRKISVGTGVTKPWTVNPIYVAAKLIPPPCPEEIKGTGVVTKCTPVLPGNGFPTDGGTGYDVGLKLDGVDVINSGINYNPEDEVVVEPNETGVKFRPVLGPFGRVDAIVPVITPSFIGDPPPDRPRDVDRPRDDNPNVGITRFPNIYINSPTGVNFSGVPIISVVRTPPLVDRSKLIQVTDLVGLKQNGYYDGRPYYGAVFYKDGIKYAGYYETAGQLVQIYDTLQESIDAEVTTPPSAILRQGTDISSDNPRLNIPGTPENLT